MVWKHSCHGALLLRTNQILCLRLKVTTMICTWFQALGCGRGWEDLTRGQRPVIEDKKWLSVHNRALKSKLPICATVFQTVFLGLHRLQFSLMCQVWSLINNTQCVLSVDVIKLLCIWWINLIKCTNDVFADLFLFSHELRILRNI